MSLIFNYLIKSVPVTMKDWVILTSNKALPYKMAKVENDFDIYYAAENANTKR